MNKIELKMKRIIKQIWKLKNEYMNWKTGRYGYYQIRKVPDPSKDREIIRQDLNSQDIIITKLHYDYAEDKDFAIKANQCELYDIKHRITNLSLEYRAFKSLLEIK